MGYECAILRSSLEVRLGRGIRSPWLAKSAGIASAPITAQGGGHLSAKASAPGRLLGFDYIAAISEKSAFLREKTVSCGNYAELNLATQARESQPKPSTTLNLSQCLCSGINEDV